MWPLGEIVKVIAERNEWAWLLWCNYLVYGLMPVFGLQAWAAYQAYYRHLAVEDFINKRTAETTTAETRLAEMTRSMHPDAVRMLLMHRKMVWRIKEVKMGDLVDWVLDADPRVHIRLVEYVLKHSNLFAMMPMNNHFSDKAYSFDPGKLVTDYEQYRAFHQLLINRMMATEALGNQAGQWIEPWNPELVARNFGVDLGDEEEMQMAEPQQTSTVPKAVPNAPVVAVTKPKVVDDIPTDAEMERIQMFENARKNMSVKEYMEFCKNNSQT
jgi:hypothetical protein